MPSDTLVLIFLLIILVAMTVTNPQNYPIVILAGLLCGAFYKYNSNTEWFDSSGDSSSGDSGDGSSADASSGSSDGSSADASSGGGDSDETNDGGDADTALGQSTGDFDQNSVDIASTQSRTKWDNGDTINRMFAREPEVTDGDRRIHDQMKNVGQQAQKAILHRTRFTSDNFRPLFQEELDEQEQKIWWEDNSLDRLFVKDGVNFNDDTEMSRTTGV
jgi:cytoskeletal protein RodZ